MSAASVVSDWEARGRRVDVVGNAVWMLDVPARTDAGLDPVLILHGFPSCSYDWRATIDALSADRRVVTLDFLGFGLSDKPDVRYGIHMQADAAEAVAAAAGLESVLLMTHDMGDSIGGELLAHRDFPVSRRVLTNGSIYLDLAHLTAGQQALLAMPDRAHDAVTAESFRVGLARTFSPKSDVDATELDAQTEFGALHNGFSLLPRTIRYIEDRRREERRYTGAIETHPSPLGVVWGADDPVADVVMTASLLAARPDARLTVLEDVGHYPMIEAPDRFISAIREYL